MLFETASGHAPGGEQLRPWYFEGCVARRAGWLPMIS